MRRLPSGRVARCRILPTRRWHGVLLITLSVLLAVSSLRGDATEAVSLGQGSGAQEDRDLLLARRVGFGRNAADGLTDATHHVTTAADNGPGSLREALARHEPLWIVFDGDYTIALGSRLQVGSHKTIDGRGRRITLTGHNVPGLVIDGAVNIVVENLRLKRPAAKPASRCIIAFSMARVIDIRS